MKYLKYILVTIYLLLIIGFLIKSVQILGINSFRELSSNDILQKIDMFKEKNYYLLVIYVFIFSLIWTIFLGFISPILLVSGYLLSPIQGAFIVSLANALSGSILLIIIRNYFLSNLEKYYSDKIKKIINLIDKDINLYFFIFRLVGGLGTPQQIQNLIPSLTKIKIKNYLFISLIGCIPLYYITSSIGYSLNFVSEIENFNVSIFSNPRFLSIIIIIINILIIIKYIKKKFKI